MLSQAGANFSRAVQTADVLVAEISFLEFIQEKENMYSLKALGLHVGAIKTEGYQDVIMNDVSHLQALISLPKM